MNIPTGIGGHDVRRSGGPAIRYNLWFYLFICLTCPGFCFSLPAGTSYAVWMGIGTVGTVILGAVLLGEPMSPMRIGCIVLIVAGILGLKFAS